MKKAIRIVLILLALIIVVVAGLLVRMKIRTDRIWNDYASIYGAENTERRYAQRAWR